jgi:GNAT superfamily N-acetyltransferase
MTKTDEPDGLTMAWCTDPGAAEALADFFTRNVTPAYVSHGEIQTGRADAPGRWCPDATAVIAGEIRAAAGESNGDQRVLVATLGGHTVAVAIASFHQRSRNPFAIVEDLIVDASRRDQGIGGRVLDWLEAAAAANGMGYVFLESGLQNSAAHTFFERHGYHTCSVTMIKRLQDT